ncbi:MAG: hypothetical protein AAGG68_27965 [Bacteroidota bacterium]
MKNVSLALLVVILSGCQPNEFDSFCANEEILSVIVNFDLERNEYFSHENYRWYWINEHDGQDTYCDIDSGLVTLKSCPLLYCTNAVRICNDSTCHTAEASSSIGTYCDQQGSIVSFELPEQTRFSVIIPIR